jgi:hypothetical protein
MRKAAVLGMYLQSAVFTNCQKKSILQPVNCMYKTDPVLFYMIVCISAVLIISLNISLFSWVKDKSLHKEIKMTKNILRKVQNPWEDEEKDLEQLHQIVDSIKNPPDQKPQ